MIRFGIIGCGRIGNRHAAHINTVGKLVAVCDTKEDSARSLANTYDVPYYTSVEDFLNANLEIDVVSVCSPNGLHAEHSIAALRAGYHVLCEKPMAITARDAGEMIKVGEQCNKRLFVIKQNRFNPPVVAVKEAIDTGKLGNILSVQLNGFWNRNKNYFGQSDWKGTKQLDGGILYTQFSHFIDLLYWLIGDVDEVYALSDNFIHTDLIDFEDTCVVALRFANGALGTIHTTINAYDHNMEGSITIFGEKGTVKIGGQYLNELEYQSIEGYEITDLPEGNPANNYGEYHGSMSNHDKVYQNIVGVLEDGASISANNFEGLKTVEIVEKIYQSIGRKK